MRLRAITNLYSEIVCATETGSYDKYGTLVAIDDSKVEVERKRLEAAEPIRLLRVYRDKLLAESDWTGLADSALTSEVSAKWKLYRQRLRDLPSGLNTPTKVKNATWPTKPA